MSLPGSWDALLAHHRGIERGWARGRLYDAATGAEELRRALAERVDQGVAHDWFYTALLAQLEAETLGTERAVARIDEAMALARQVEYRCNLPCPHLLLLRGKLLLEHDPPNPTPAEEAFQPRSRSRSSKARAVGACARLCRSPSSTNRQIAPLKPTPSLAHALEGFSPTPEMPEIAEAQALLEQLEGSRDSGIAAEV